MKRPHRFFTVLSNKCLGHIFDTREACESKRCVSRASVKAILASSRVRGRAAARMIWRRVAVWSWFLLRSKIFSYASDTFAGKPERSVSISDRLLYSLGLSLMISNVRCSQRYVRCSMLFSWSEILFRSFSSKSLAISFTLASITRLISLLIWEDFPSPSKCRYAFVSGNPLKDASMSSYGRLVIRNLSFEGEFRGRQ